MKVLLTGAAGQLDLAGDAGDQGSFGGQRRHGMG